MAIDINILMDTKRLWKKLKKENRKLNENNLLN